MQTPREIVTRCLTFDNPERLPRDLWLLPWTAEHFPITVDEIIQRFPNDFTGTDYLYKLSTRVKGDSYKIDYSTDV